MLIIKLGVKEKLVATNNMFWFLTVAWTAAKTAILRYLSQKEQK